MKHPFDGGRDLRPEPGQEFRQNYHVESKQKILQSKQQFLRKKLYVGALLITKLASRPTQNIKISAGIKNLPMRHYNSRQISSQQLQIFYLISRINGIYVECQTNNTQQIRTIMLYVVQTEANSKIHDKFGDYAWEVQLPGSSTNNIKYDVIIIGKL